MYHPHFDFDFNNLLELLLTMLQSMAMTMQKSVNLTLDKLAQPLYLSDVLPPEMITVTLGIMMAVLEERDDVATMLEKTTQKEMMTACSMGESMEQRYPIPRCTPRDLRCLWLVMMEGVTGKT